MKLLSLVTDKSFCTTWTSRRWCVTQLDISWCAACPLHDGSFFLSPKAESIFCPLCCGAHLQSEEKQDPRRSKEWGAFFTDVYIHAADAACMNYRKSMNSLDLYFILKGYVHSAALIVPTWRLCERNLTSIRVQVNRPRFWRCDVTRSTPWLQN